MKLKTTLSSDTKIHHWGVGYGGTTGMGNGPTNPYTNATGSWRSSSLKNLKQKKTLPLIPITQAYRQEQSSTSLDLSGKKYFLEI